VTSSRAASEPLLWLQLLGGALLPLEALLVLLLLAGSDPGPLPSLERLLCWAIGGLAPALLLWRRPADIWSLLFVQTPARGRRDLQRRLSALQATTSLKLGLALGCALLLVLLWRLDRAAALASALAPLPEAPRLVDLLLTAPLLALMLWQWQQLLQALWLLGRSPATIAATAPMAGAELAQQRLSPGLPLLLPQPLGFDRAAALEPPGDPETKRQGQIEARENDSATGTPAEPEGAIEPIEGHPEPIKDGDVMEPGSAALAKARDGAVEIVDVEVEGLEGESLAEPSDPSDAASTITGAVAVEPDQGSEQAEGPELDQPVG
jgi:hypothetical protein